MPMRESVLVIACGALAREIDALRDRYGWDHLRLVCLDPRLHNRPEQIPGQLRSKILEHRNAADRIFVAYADCGTAGGIDRVIAEFGQCIERLPGAHCYEAYAGHSRFFELANDEPGTFYLTDFLARNFERLVIRPLGLDRHPELRGTYFGHYRRVMLLSQARSGEVFAAARKAAQRLGLEFVHEECGYGTLGEKLRELTARVSDGQENSHLLA